MLVVTGPGPFPHARLVRAHRMCIQLAEEMGSLATHAGCSQVALDCSRALEEVAEWRRVEQIFAAAASALQIAATTLHDKFNCDGELGPADEPLFVDMGATWAPLEQECAALIAEEVAREPSAATPAAPTAAAPTVMPPEHQPQRHHQLRELAMLAPAGDAEGTSLLARMDHGLSSSSSTAAAPETKGKGKSKSKGGHGDHPKGKGKKAEGGYKFYPRGKGKDRKWVVEHA